jgi:ABC-type sugar transport system permease subunit
LARKSGTEPGDVVRYKPATEPMVAAMAIAILTVVEVVFAFLFIFLLVTSGPANAGSTFALAGQTWKFEGNSLEVQQAEAFALGSALLTLGAILSLYRKFFLPDVMIVKKRKLKYEDLM